MDKFVKLPARPQKVHVVLAPLVDTDFSLSARIAAALMGGLYATPQDFLARDESRRGIMYAVKYKSLKDSFHVAVSPSLEVELSTRSPLFESHRSGTRKLLQAVRVRTQAVQVFPKDRARHTADSEEGFRSRHAGRAS